METYKNALKEIRSQTSQINIIDVGCARGAFLRHVKDFFSDVYSVGIDPLDHGSHRSNYSMGDFTHYIQCAIDDVDADTKAKFFVISFTSDWLYPTQENKDIVIALNSIGADVGFVEIKSDKGHDSFLLDVPDFLNALKNFLDKSYEEN